MIPPIIRSGMLLVIVVVVAWFSVAAGLGEFYAQRVADGDATAIDPALSWQPGNARALLGKAARLRDEDPADAVALLQRAYRANTADPRPLIVLAQRSDQVQDWERSDALITFAGRLAPADAQVQLQVASHWALRGRPELALRHLATVLAVDSARQATLFPVLVEVADSPDLRHLFAPLVESPPVWWSGFFRYLAAKAADLDTVRYCYNLRRKDSRTPLTAEERAAYVARLQREGMIAEAYVVWIVGLDHQARDKLGLLFDGSFELPLEYPGFGWQVSEDKHFSAKPAPIQGGTGPTALRLRFRAFDGYFSLLSQSLFLDPGAYRLSGRARPDGLVSKGGVRWQVRCVLPAVQVLGDGPRFVGTADWGNFDLRFQVPDTCVYQQLILVSAGERSFEYPLDGTLWLDDMKLVRVSDPDATAHANAPLTTKGSDQKRR